MDDSYVNVVDSFGCFLFISFVFLSQLTFCCFSLFLRQQIFPQCFNLFTVMSLPLLSALSSRIAALPDRGSVRWIVFFESLLLSEIIHMHLFNSFYVRHKLHIPKLILINAVSCCLITERFIHVSWNASCKRSCRSLCWTTKMKFWPHWTQLLMTQVSQNIFILSSSLELFINHGKSEVELKQQKNNFFNVSVWFQLSVHVWWRKAK